MEALVIAGVTMLVLLLLFLIIDAASSSSSSDSFTDIRRSSDATIDKMRRTSESFREHIDRETRR